MSTFKDLSDKFLLLSLREQVMILITGIVAIVMVIFSVLLDSRLAQVKTTLIQNRELASSNQALKASVNELQMSLQQDPNIILKQQIQAYQNKLNTVDQTLLSLTSELINPVEMRNALSKLLKLERGVKLSSFEVLAAEPVSLVNTETTANSDSNASPSGVQSNKPLTENKTPASDLAQQQYDNLKLYRHGIKITLTGSYFELRNYLAQLEKLPWKFFWQQFDYHLTEYPKGELEIQMYSLSTKRDFIGV